MFNMNIIILTFLSLIVVTLGDKPRRNLPSMSNTNPGMSNLNQWYGPPLPGYGGYQGFPFFNPIDPQKMYQEITARNKAMQDSINARISEQMKQEDCELVEVARKEYVDLDGKTRTMIRKTCKINGPEGSSSSSTSSSEPSSDASSSSSSSSPVSDQGSSSSSSSGPDAGSFSGSGSGSYSSAGNGMAVSSASGK